MTELNIREVPPDHIHGYPVLHVHPIDHDGTYRIICYRANEYDRFVVATWSRHSPREWAWGHYFDDLMTAVEYFNGRGNE